MAKELTELEKELLAALKALDVAVRRLVIERHMESGMTQFNLECEELTNSRNVINKAEGRK